MKLQQKISRIENGKNSLVEIRKITVRKLRFYKWLRKLITKKSAYEKMLDRRVS